MYKHSDLIFPSYLDRDSKFFVLTGFALNGPVNTPFIIQDDINPFDVLGRTKLAENYLIARESGINPLVLRTNGAHAKCIIEHESLGEEIIRLVSLEANDMCNNITVHMYPTHMIVKGLYEEKIYYFNDYKRSSDLVNAIKMDLYYAGGEVDAELLSDLTLKGVCTEDMQLGFEGGDNGARLVPGTTPDSDMAEEDEEEEEYDEEYGKGEEPDPEYVEELSEDEKEEVLEDEDDLDVEPGSSFEEVVEEDEDQEVIDEDKLEEQLDNIKETLFEEYGDEYHNSTILNEFNIDTMVFTDIPYEVSPEELTSIFGMYAKNKTKEQKLFCSVVLGSELLSSERNDPEMQEEDEEPFDEFSEEIKLLEEISPRKLNQDNHLQHVEIVLGLQNNNYSSGEPISCATSYASTRYNLELYESATNKSIETLSSLFGEKLKKDEVANLSRNGYICIVASIRKGFVPYLSQNCYSKSKLLSKPHYLRSVHNDVKLASEFLENHIGESVDDKNIQPISQELTIFLEDRVKENPFYREIEHDIVQVSGSELNVYINFHLFGEIESVRSSLGYKKSREVFISWN